MKLYDWYKRNFQRREDWKFRCTLVVIASVGYQVAVYLLPVVWNPLLFVVFFAFLLFGIDFLADRRMAHKAKREAAQKQRAEEFDALLDRAFGPLDK